MRWRHVAFIYSMYAGEAGAYRMHAIFSRAVGKTTTTNTFFLIIWLTFPLGQS